MRETHRANQQLILTPMNLSKYLGLSVFWLGAWVFAGIGDRALGEPFLPRNGEQVIEMLRTKALDSNAHEIRDLRTRLTAEPTNASLACQLARKCIERSRSEADPRYLGRAQAALGYWWDAAKPPVDVLVLRATIKQSQHDFTNALNDLDIALKLDPRNVQVWLTRATILTVLGDYALARKACLPLAQLTPGLISLTAAASVASLNGQAENACKLLQKALRENPNAALSERVWAMNILAEAFERLGKNREAEDTFKAALELSPSDPYLSGAFADFLMDQGRNQEAVNLLRDEKRSDGLLLRLAIAESQCSPRPAGFGLHLASLSARFEAGHLRGDFVHQREEARFKLCLLNQPFDALQTALENWRVQHEPADLRILLESAVAAKNSESAKPALEFMRTNKLEYIELAKLGSKMANP